MKTLYVSLNDCITEVGVEDLNALAAETLVREYKALGYTVTKES